MKRIAILTAFSPESYSGGIETFILNLKSFLSDQNIRVDTHCIYPEPTLPVKPFPIKSLNKIVPEFLLSCFMMGKAFSRIEKDYDLVITNNFYGLGYFAPRVKSINIYHSTHAGYADALKEMVPKKDYRTLKYLYGYAGDYLSGRGKVKIAVSQRVRDELEKYYKFKNVTIVNHGIDIHFFKKVEEMSLLRKKWEIPLNAFVGLFAGRWEIGKGTDVIEEMIRLRPDIFWILVIGPSHCPLDIYPNMSIIKNADRTTMKELYSLSDFMLFPSFYEGFGLTIVEALACKLPVICTKVGVAKDLQHINSLRKLILPTVNKREIINEIIDRISFIKKGKSEINEIAKRGRKIIEMDYNIDAWKKKMAAALGLSN